MKKIDKMYANPAIQVSQNRIYIYETPNNLDTQGYLKIGQTKRDSEERIIDQTNTAMIKAKLLADFEAVDDSGQVFEDKEIHQFLRERGVKNLKHSSGSPSEWFKISIEDAKKVIENRKHFVDDFAFLKEKPIEIQLYPSQQEALDRTYARWLIARENPGASSPNIRKFLWNAKPRFGKTLTAYKFAERIQAKNVLVMTQRTSISNAWFSDYHDYIRNSADSSYEFGSSKDNKIENEETVHAQALSEKESEKIAHDPNKSLIYYTTLANIKGKDEAGKFKEKNKWIFSAHWDLVILDETHEGTTTNAMYRVLETLDHDFLLELSGTPFRKMSETHGYTAKNTYSWSYIEEQEAKENWDYSRGKNPYINLPKLNIYTFQVPQSVRVESDLSDYAFDFNEFFKVSKGEFIHDQKIDEFLDILSNRKERPDDAQTQYYPFADNDTREQLRHTFWKLPSTAAAELMKQKLEAHEFFRDYQIIKAYGSADGQNSMKAEKELKAKIGKNGLKTKTITLSVDMLTTGTTVKEWTAVLMLDNSTSASKYIQTAFRAQTPWSAKLDNGETFTKTDAFVFDFNPDRVLKVAEEYANMDTSTGTEVVGGSTSERQAKTYVLLNFLPIIAMDEDGEMRYLDAKDATNIINYTGARKTVDEGFMSSSLFNVKALFRLKGAAFERAAGIANKLEPVSVAKKQIKNAGDVPKDNPEGKYQVEKEKILTRSGLGEKKYAAIEEAVAENPDAGMDIIDTIREKPGGEEITPEDLRQFEEAKKPLDKAEQKRKSDEEKFRDRLRGFSRTIPVLLMAYGTHEMNLRNFHKYITPENFEQITGITKDDYDFLLQAKTDTGEPIFVEGVFNAAIHEFLKRKKATENYYTGEVADDIYNYIPSQENNRVFTPKHVVNMMLDALEAENPAIFKSEHTKILDLYVKSGNFLAEAAKRFYKYSKDKDIERIIENQLFGIAPFEIYATLAQETVYGFANNKFKNRLRNRNIRPEPRIHQLVKENKLEEVIKEHFGNMKFDVVIGNPPYQENDNGKRDDGSANASASPIYHHFIESAEKISSVQCFVIPSRWAMGAGKGLKKFTEKMMSDKNIQSFHYFTDPKMVFPDNDIKGGVCYFVRKKGYSAPAHISVYTKEGVFESERYLNSNGEDVFIPYAELASILSKVQEKTIDLGNNNIQKIVSVRKPYGLSTDFLKNQSKYNLPTLYEKRQAESDLEIFGLGEKNRRISKFVPADYPLPAGRSAVKCWKVFVPYAYGCGAIGEEIPSPILGSPIQICTETYLRIGKFKTRDEAESMLKYLKSKFFRAMVGILKTTQHSTTTYRLVPLQDFAVNSDIDWSKSVAQIDQQLYKKYGLSEQEIAFIEEKVREME